MTLISSIECNLSTESICGDDPCVTVTCCLMEPENLASNIGRCSVLFRPFYRDRGQRRTRQFEINYIVNRVKDLRGFEA